MKRRYAAIDGRGIISVQEDEIGPPPPGRILVKVYASLISPGTELGQVKAKRQKPNPSVGPKMFGYQNAGIVEAVGEGVTRFKVGDRVACMGGGYAPHATYGLCPVNLAAHLPKEVSFDEGAYNHLAATAMQAIRRAQLQIGHNVAVFGLGLIGQLCCNLARIGGCRVIGVDRFGVRLSRALKVGAHAVANPDTCDIIAAVNEFTENEGLDCAILAFGGDATETFAKLMKMMKTSPDGHQMGTIVAVGGCHMNVHLAASTGNVDIRSSARTGPGYHDEAWEHGKDYPPVFVEWTTQRNLKVCIRLIAERELKVWEMTTHRMPLSKAPEACEELIEHPDRALGVILLPQEE
jgi:NADPH2:quinone reductase